MAKLTDFLIIAKVDGIYREVLLTDHERKIIISILQTNGGMNLGQETADMPLEPNDNPLFIEVKVKAKTNNNER